MTHSKKIIAIFLFFASQSGFSRGLEYDCTLQTNQKFSHFSAFWGETTTYEFNGYKVIAGFDAACPGMWLIQEELNASSLVEVGGINEYLNVHLNIGEDKAVAFCRPKNTP